ncbi:dihydroneopterin aldolase [Marinospirillum perlucidum]|uniref:dihydroneopterin aldolase n=1 Tax=Marinospirillum perlucidum TaxID=1982602 RepID=UPI000DF49C5F|nr:dihydroneopterin aldolase [Marinospirillum perlucidum]
MHDKIFIRGLSFLASIGVFDWEKQQLQKLELDLELATDIRAAAQDEDLNKTLDYASISERLMQLAQSQHHDLLETLAEKMTQMLLSEFNTSSVTLTLAKPGAVASAQSVGVTLIRPYPQMEQQ